jgi:hypothetical protein
VWVRTLCLGDNVLPKDAEALRDERATFSKVRTAKESRIGESASREARLRGY